MELCIKAKMHDYQVLAEPGALSRLGAYLCALRPLRWAVVADEAVAALYGERVCGILGQQGLTAGLITVAAGEAHKTLGAYEKLCRTLIARGFTRTDGILALGGGMVGDLAGFAAATLLRGVTLVQVPTTLLAQVDSAVGGKVGIDLPEGKNLLGAFYPPALTVVDPEVLDTLDARQLRSGVAEVIKYGLIADESILQQLMAEALHWPRLIESCLAVKKRLVEEDEEDRGPRRALNFGHTFGHAYEALGGYETYTHGEAVAAGMAQMLRWQCASGIGGMEVYDRLLPLLEKYGLPSRIDCSREQCLEYLCRDKKAQGRLLQVVTVPAVGSPELLTVSPQKLCEVAL